MNNLEKLDEKPREGTLKQLRDLRTLLNDLCVKSKELDEENVSLKKKVKNMKGQIGTALDTMKTLKEDLKKTREMLNKSQIKSKVKLTV